MKERKKERGNESLHKALDHDFSYFLHMEELRGGSVLNKDNTLA